MNLFDVLKGNKRITIQRSDAPSGAYLVVEVAKSETHTLTANATEYPVENGVSISDHILNKGVIYEISGIISDDPIDFLNASVIDRFRAPFLEHEKIYSSQVSQTRSFANDSPSKNAFYLLNILYYQKIPVNIITDLTEYKNMVMESLTIPRDQNTYRALKFDARFREVLLAQSEWIENLAEYNPAEALSQPQKNEGSKDGIATTSDPRDAGYRILQLFSKLFGITLS